MPRKKQHSHPVGIGLSLAAAAALGALADHFLYGENGPENREKVKGWMLKAKGEVLEELEKLENISEEKYGLAVEKMREKYSQMQDIDPAELEKLAGDLKQHWHSVVKKLQL